MKFTCLAALTAIVSFTIPIMITPSAEAQETRRVTVALGTLNEGAHGAVNQGLGQMTNAIGSYRAYFDGQDSGRVEYDGASTFTVSADVNYFQLYEHVLFNNKSVSNRVEIRSVGRERRLGIFESVDDVFILCFNTRDINFNCEAISRSAFTDAVRQRTRR